MTENPELMAKKVAAILKLDEKTHPYLKNLFQKIKPTKKAGSSMLKIGNYTLLIQYPQYHEASQPYNFTVIALNLIEKKFVSNIKISIEVGPKNERIFTGLTNEQGWCGISLVISSEDLVPLRIIAEDKFSGDTASTKISPKIFTSEIPTISQTHLSIITDKELYKLGQQLRYIGICWAEFDGCFFPLTKNKDTRGFTIQLIDTESKTLFEKSLEPTSYGIVWDDFPIVENLPEGIYKLRLQYNDNGASQDISFEVKQYKTPEIELTVSLDSKWVLKTESEKEFEYPLFVKYFYGDPVKNALIQLQLKNVSFYDKKRWRYRIIDTPKPVILYTTRSDEKGNANINIKPTEQYITKEIVENFRYSTEKSDFLQIMETGEPFTLNLIIKVVDEQEREIKKEWPIECSANVLNIKKEHIVFDSEKETATFKCRIEDKNNKGFSGSLHLRLEDEYKTVQSINKQFAITEGKLEVQLMPRVVFGLAPKISLKGIISYEFHGRTMKLEFSCYYGPEELVSEGFELIVPEKIEFGTLNSFELKSKTYMGPIWLQYGKNEIFAQVSGNIGGKHGSFKHEIKIPKSYVGDLVCMINYFDFKKKMEVRTLKKLIKIPIEHHLLPFKVDFPLNANPGEKVVAKVHRLKKTLEPWLLAFKLADKSLRGLDAMTEFDLDTIYSLTEKLSISSLALWSKDLDNILADLEAMIRKVLKQTNYEPNIFIVLHQLDNILRTNFPKYEYKSLGMDAKSLMSRYFKQLRGNIDTMFDFFEELTIENYKLAASNFGDFFFKKESLSLDFFARYYITLIRYNPDDKTHHDLLLEYLNGVFLEKLQTAERSYDTIYTFYTGIRTLHLVDDEEIQKQDQNILEFIEQLKVLIRKILDFFNNNKAGFTIPSKIRHGLELILSKVSRIDFAKGLFLERYRYFYYNKKVPPQLSNEIPALEKLGLLRDMDVLERFVSITESIIYHINRFFDEKIELEKDEKVWGAIPEILEVLKKVNQMTLNKPIKEVLTFVFSEKFYAKIYGGEYLYLRYPSLEKDISKINRLTNFVQRKSLIKVILTDLKKHLFYPYKELEPLKLVSQILYNRFYIKRILELIDWEELPKNLLDLKSQLLLELDYEKYFMGVLNKILEPLTLKNLIKISPKQFIDALNIWQKRVNGKEPYDFSKIGELPENIEINAKELFNDSFGKDVLNIYEIYYGKLAEAFLFHLKKADYGILQKRTSYYYSIEVVKNDYIVMLDFMNRVEHYFESLKTISDDFNGKLSTLKDNINLITKEHIFKVFYLYFLNEVKKPETFEIGSFYNFHNILDVFQPDPKEQIEFKIKAPHSIKDFIFNNNISHLTPSDRDNFLYFIAGNFVYNYNFSKILPREGSTILKDYSYYKDRIKNCIKIFNEAQVSKENYRQDLLDKASEMDNFEAFWKFFDPKKAMIDINYFIDSINELEAQTSSYERELLTLNYKSLLNFFLENFKEDFSMGLIWYRNPNLPQDYKDKCNTLISSFKKHPLAHQFKNDLELLEYYFIDVGVQIKAYYKDVINAYDNKEIPFISIWDRVWFGIDSISVFPNVIGYPRYTSIMTDVEHYRGYSTRIPASSELKERESSKAKGAEKKITVRKNFADIGFYKIIPSFNKESESVEIQLPDSITTQELHVASFNQKCNMNYLISEVKVSQEFFIKDNFSEILNWKDTIEGNIVITNTTHDSLDVKVKIEQFDALNPEHKYLEEPLKFSFKSPTSFTLKPKGINNIKLIMSANKCGKFLIKIIADSEKYRDEVQKIIRIKAGFPSDINTVFEFMHSSDTQKGDEKRFSLPIPAKGVDYEYSLSIYPSLTSHILDGIEANLKYPYGCIEQTFSALMPNLVYYDYLNANNRLSGEVKQKLERNIISGYLKLQSHQNYEGGFGWWQNSKTSIFLTAMVLYAYKLLYKHHFLVETYTIKQIISYLLKETLDKKMFYWHLPKKREHRRRLSRFTDITLTSYVLSALQEIRETKLFDSDHEFLFTKAVNKLKDANYEGITDCYLLYLLYKNYMSSNPEELPALIKQIKKYRLKPYWMQGSAIGSDVETTARLTQLLWKNKEISETTRNEIIEWIYTQKSPYGGWKTTSDTRSVVELLISMLENESCDLIMSIECNGNKILEDKHITLDNLSSVSYELGYIPLNQYLNKNDHGEENELVISVKGNGAPAIKLVQENWIERKPAPMEGLSINRICNKTRIERYSTTNITLDLKIPLELDEMVIIEEPLIPAAHIDQESLDTLIKIGSIIGFKYVDNTIAFFLPPGNEKRKITYKIVAYKTFNGSQGPAKIYPMYKPHKNQYGNATHYSFYGK